MTELVLTRGYPASGKTTFARGWVAVLPALRARVNRDDLRAMLFGARWGLTGLQEDAVTTAQVAAVVALLQDGLSVVVDDTNLRPGDAERLIGAATGCGPGSWRVVDIMTPVDECVDRDLARRERGEPAVGDTAIYGFADRYPMPWPEIAL